MVARNIKKSGSTLLKFHRMERLHVVAIAAGMVHSLALTDDGTLFYWVSSDPDLRCQQVFFFLTNLNGCKLPPFLFKINMPLTYHIIVCFFAALFLIWEKFGERICREILDCCSYKYR